MRFDDKEFLANRIKYHRNKMNLTQAELAEKVELSDQHISRIENGCYIPSLKSFFLLVNALQIDLSEFGFTKNCSENPIKNELIEKINLADNKELIFYQNAIQSIDSSLEKLKENYHIFPNI